VPLEAPLQILRKSMLPLTNVEMVGRDNGRLSKVKGVWPRDMETKGKTVDIYSVDSGPRALVGYRRRHEEKSYGSQNESCLSRLARV